MSKPTFQRSLRETVRPALLRALEPERNFHPAVMSGACRALAISADDPTVIAPLTALTAQRDDVDAYVRESAVLSLGLLRRSDRTRQFAAADLDPLRSLLLGLAEFREAPVRVRAFALLAVGLLADQPSDRPAGEVVVPRLLTLLARVDALAPDLTRELTAAGLRALALQPWGSVPRDAVKRFEETLRSARTSDTSAVDFAVGHTALALGALGDAGTASVLIETLRGPQRSPRTRRCASLAIGRLGERMDAATRAQVAFDLSTAMTGRSAEAEIPYGLAALGRLLEADIREGAPMPPATKNPRIRERLLARLRNGSPTERGWAALALGRVCRAIGDRRDMAAYGSWTDVVRALREDLADAREDPGQRGACAIALGIAGDACALPTLIRILSDTKAEARLRSHAASAIGLIRVRRPDTVNALVHAHARRDFVAVRTDTVSALGLLGASEALGALLPSGAEGIDVLEDLAPMAFTIVELGDETTVATLVRMLEDNSVRDLDRLLACTSLGAMADPEPVPSLARLLRDMDLREHSSALFDLRAFR
jgi:hypothetical protein